MNDDQKFVIHFSTSISSYTGASGHISLSTSSEPFELDAVKMATLVVKVQTFFEELKAELSN